MKAKKITKKSEYLSFFKYHFQKLKSEHSRWTNPQLTSVVRLLWKKKKSMASKVSGSSLRQTKPISGRKFFLKVNRERGLSAMDGMRKWRALPLETRNLYKKEGNPNMQESNRMMTTRVSWSSGSNMKFDGLNFLNSK